ncbi:hypothetical protein ETD86_17830 [Nonomuraea turkmeniaca]|uniref:50S ribosomal protein L31 n=1 Tax=Nonomuraea turkmeniaca TaxID=103838 RepID=A0A5S4FJF4_9ACTN|nr:hypothetical protein ETD86_17830 [Nonomuraea turkmeniaca]
MKKGIHPGHRRVVFRDPGVDFAFLARSTITSDKTIEWTDGSVERFDQRYGRT